MTVVPRLPIDDVLPQLKSALAASNCCVLVAPPGAGKTTRVPLALLDEAWLAGRRIIVLEPRRIAARGAARHMADLLGEQLGDSVGLRARLATAVGPGTRIEVVTEGVFTRMIIGDPELTDIGAVLFDEFHERSLDADLGLALARDAQQGLREDLRLLVMSATLDDARIASLLGDAPIIRSEGRGFPIETRYVGRGEGKRLEDHVAETVRKALSSEQGSALVFLPGQGEIRRVTERLEGRLGPDIDIVPLHGSLDLAGQIRATAPAEPGRRKVVLSTAIAETSLTIEGVRIVIDSGYARVPRYEPDIGITRLETVRVSRASADQRRGRAGRLEPGVAVRLWDEPETRSLLPFAEPEIRAADLTSLVLDCAAWGVVDIARLDWLDPPLPGPLEAAHRSLRAIEAIDAQGRLTDRGRAIRDIPLPPRLAVMLLAASRTGAESTASRVAAVIAERGLGGMDIDVASRLRKFESDHSPRASQMRKLAASWASTARDHSDAMEATVDVPSSVTSVGSLLAQAFPDRIGIQRGARGTYLLANGRAGSVPPGDPIASSRFIIAVEVTGRASSGRITLAASLSPVELEIIARDRIVEALDVAWDEVTERVQARATRRLGAIVLSTEPRALTPEHHTAHVLAQGLARRGIDRLPWSKGQLQFRDRIALARKASADDEDIWPDLSDDALAASVESWLAPFLDGLSRASDVSADMLGNALDMLVPWEARRRLDEEMPTHFAAPTGNRHAIDYEGPTAPSISLRVQEMFGVKVHPCVGRNRLPLTLELLSPAGRPVQTTRDLPGFWRGSWQDVRAEMRGRYPKHVWPEDPANAEPTSRAKPRGR